MSDDNDINKIIMVGFQISQHVYKSFQELTLHFRMEAYFDFVKNNIEMIVFGAIGIIWH